MIYLCKACGVEFQPERQTRGGICCSPGCGAKLGREARAKKMAETETDRFWARVKKTDGGCWEWTGSKQKLPRGYGTLRFHRKPALAHRVAFFLTHGKFPDDLACHSCDNPSCCRPSHLWNGTHADNAQDMVRKGRQNDVRGEGNGHSKLSSNDIIAIRRSKAKSADLADQYSIRREYVWQIRTKQVWRHLP